MARVSSVFHNRYCSIMGSPPLHITSEFLVVLSQHVRKRVILVSRAIRILRVRVGGARKGRGGRGKNTYGVSVQVFVG